MLTFHVESQNWKTLLDIGLHIKLQCNCDRTRWTQSYVVQSGVKSLQRANCDPTAAAIAVLIGRSATPRCLHALVYLSPWPPCGCTVLPQGKRLACETARKVCTGATRTCSIQGSGECELGVGKYLSRRDVWLALDCYITASLVSHSRVALHGPAADKLHGRCYAIVSRSYRGDIIAAITKVV